MVDKSGHTITCTVWYIRNKVDSDNVNTYVVCKTFASCHETVHMLCNKAHTATGTRRTASSCTLRQLTRSCTKTAELPVWIALKRHWSVS